MKKLISTIAMFAVLFSLSACSGDSNASNTVSKPSDKTLRADIQSYITEILGSDAEISIFEVNNSTLSGSDFKAICTALYGGNTGEFTLSYSLENGNWELVSCRVTLKDNNTSPPSTESENEPSPSPSTEPEGGPSPSPSAGPTEMSDKLYDFTFTLDGVVYQLPCAYTNFTENGWTISSTGYSEDSTLSANSYDYVNMAKAGNKVTVYLINLSGNERTIKDCKIGGISVTKSNLNDVNLFVCANGISTASTQDDVIAAYGSGNTINTYDDRAVIKYTKDSYIDATFSCYKENTRFNEITLRNFVSDDSDITETSTDVPDYLSQYVVPAELGSDLTTPKMILDGDMYSLPAPVSAFLDNGWVITSKSDSVGAGNKDSIRIERNGVKIYVSIINFANYQTIPENCAVHQISIYNTDNVSVKLPCELTFLSTKEDVENAVTDEFDYTKGTYSYTYSYSEYRNVDLSIYLYVDVDTELLSHVSISCKTWNYQ